MGKQINVEFDKHRLILCPSMTSSKKLSFEKEMQYVDLMRVFLTDIRKPYGNPIFQQPQTSLLYCDMCIGRPRIAIVI